MPRIALIQDGTEVARQAYADVADCYREACRSAWGAGTENDVEVVTDERVDYFLDGITPDHCSCVVLASNALLSEATRRSIERRRDDLHKFIATGGGMIVMHQLVEDIGWLLPSSPQLRLRERTTASTQAATAADPEDALLWQPNVIDVSRLCDRIAPDATGAIRGGREQTPQEHPSGSAAGPRRLYWMALDAADFGSAYRPVITVGDECVLARSATDARIVLCSIPLDWHRSIDLTANAIRSATVGSPDRVIWRSGTGAEHLPLQQRLSRPSAAVRRLPEADGEIASEDLWLLRHTRFGVAPTSEDLARLAATDYGRTFLTGGGTLVSVEEVPYLGGIRFEALLGPRELRPLITDLLAELRAVDGWQTPAYAFELRNIVSAIRFATSLDPEHPGIIRPAKLQGLRKEVLQRLADPVHREDLGSSIALGQAAIFMSDKPSSIAATMSWLEDAASDRSWDVQAQAHAVMITCGQADRSAFASRIVDGLSDGQNTLASAVRAADAAAFVSVHDDMMDADALRVREALAARVADEVFGDRSSISVEALADIGRALALLRGRSGNAAEADEQMRAARIRLVRALDHYERNAKGIAWRSRVLEAVLAIDRESPPDLDRLAPFVGASGGEQWSHATDGLEALSSANDALGNERDDLQALVPAARFGYAVANGLAAAVVMLVAVVVGKAMVGGSVAEVLGAVAGGGSVLLALSVALATLLETAGLLLPSARDPYLRARTKILGLLFIKD